MPTAAELNQRFAIRDHLSFHDSSSGGLHSGMTEIRIATAAAEATIYTQGAHLTRWNPAGQQPVLYLSPKSNFTPGKAIRGGVPVLFPWFGNGWDGEHQPTHGFARISEWTVESTHLDPVGDVHLALSLTNNAQSAAIVFPAFRAVISFRIGRDLGIALEVTNLSDAPLTCEEGLHTYLAVSDIHQVATEGLEGSTYVDKRDGNTRKVQRDRLLRYTRDVDQVHVQTEMPLTVHDPVSGRELHIQKRGSNTTVTWNPWSVLMPGLPDLPADSWRHFVCVETVNAGDDRLTLQPGETHRMESILSVSRAA